MKILFLTPTLPSPPDLGGKIVVFNTLRRLYPRHELHLLSFIQAGQERHIESLRQYCKSIQVVPLSIEFRFSQLISNLFLRLPYTIHKYSSSEVEAKFRQLLETVKPDLVQVEHLHLFQYIHNNGIPPVILREHNVESLLMKRYSENARNPLARAYARIQYRKLFNFEKQALKNTSLCLALTEEDQKELNKISLSHKIEVLPPGVDFDYFRPLLTKRDHDAILFLGNLIYKPTQEALFFFLKRIWPLVLEKRPHLRLVQIGRCPITILEKIKNTKNLKVCGLVKDIRPIVSSCSLLVVPFTIGSGIRIKILEAMAMKLPVVSTSVGCEGIGLTDQEDCLLADDPEDFADKIGLLIDDRRLAEQIANRAHDFVRTNYDWDKIIDKLNNIYQMIIGSLNGAM